MPITLSITHARYALKQNFTISRGSRTHADIVQVVVSDGVQHGQGACVPYARYGESVESVMGELQHFADTYDINASTINTNLHAGAARNAIDCAFWDYTVKANNTNIAALLNATVPSSVESAYTLSLDTPDNMHKQARDKSHYPLLKMKCGSPQDIEAIKAVRLAAPNAKLILDANEGWDVDFYKEALPLLQQLNVAMIEQPFHAEHDEALRDLPRPIAICADESCHTSHDLSRLKPLYDIVNIKLDKTGGLTEALKLKNLAQEQNFDIMIGCMMGSSLTIAPAFYLINGASYIDLDAPMLLKEDCDDAMTFDETILHAPSGRLWG